MLEGRKRTPMPIPEREALAQGSGPVITYKLSPEELEIYRATGKLIREEESMITIDKERYLQLRLQGIGRTRIMRSHFKNPTAFYDQLRAWGIKEKDAEERELDLFAAKVKPKAEPPVTKQEEVKPVETTLSSKIEIDLDEAGETTPIEPGEAANVNTPPQDQPTSLVKQIEELIKQHSSELSVTSKIKQWATDRNLHTADPAKQMLKLGEEYGELCQGMAKGNQEQIIDSIGDIYVVLTVLSLQLGLDIEKCIDQAYEEIKDRKGKMINGVFVKQEDIA